MYIYIYIKIKQINFNTNITLFIIDNKFGLRNYSIGSSF